jgi:membrane fusion protein, multidrug efflux system
MPQPWDSGGRPVIATGQAGRSGLFNKATWFIAKHQGPFAYEDLPKLQKSLPRRESKHGSIRRENLKGFLAEQFLANQVAEECISWDQSLGSAREQLLSEARASQFRLTTFVGKKRMEPKTSTASSDPRYQFPAETRSVQPKSRRVLVWVLTLGALAVILFLILHFQNGSKAAAASPSGRRGMTGPVPTILTTAQKGNIGVYLDAIGTVTPVYTASITSEVMGLVTQVHYTEGELLRKGQPLIDIDPRPFEAQLLQAEGTLERDTGVLDEAKMDLDRYREAWAKNGIPKQTLDDQEKVVLQDEGTVKNDQGVVQFDKVQVDFCHITSPITGRVGLRLIDPGNVVQPSTGTILAVITQVQPITVIFTVAEDSLSQVQAQLRHGTRLTVDAFDRAQQKKIATGKLLTFDNLIDTTTGTVKMRALFDNKNNALFPNQFVNTRLLVNTEQGVTLIPTSAIQHNGESAFVYVIQNDTAQIRNIQTGVSDGGQTAVMGINPGDVLANSSFDKLQNNSKIVVSKQAPPANSSESQAP